MSYLLDTNVVSEARRRRADPRVTAWLRAVPSRELFMSALVVGEIRRGVERLRPADSLQAVALERWLSELRDRFGDRIIAIDDRVADVWGRLSAVRPLDHMECLSGR